MRRALICLTCLIAFAAVPAAGFAKTASQAQYGGGEGTIETGPGTTPTQETAPAEAQRSPTEVSGPADPAPTGRLPFTGQDIILMVLAGAGLLGLGFALRRVSGRSPAGP